LVEQKTEELSRQLQREKAEPGSSMLDQLRANIPRMDLTEICQAIEMLTQAQKERGGRDNTKRPGSPSGQSSDDIRERRAEFERSMEQRRGSIPDSYEPSADDIAGEETFS
jgi:hypothetical protein